MDGNAIRLFRSRKSDNWLTPKNLYVRLNREFRFNFDPCPTNPSFDGLRIQWKQRCFVNPPYSKVAEFLSKGLEEIDHGNTKIAVYLLFANTDTAWFHEYVARRAEEIRFIRGRLKFLEESGRERYNAMRPSMIVVFKSKRR